MSEPWQITGTTRVYGILADPIAQVRTPQVLNAAFRSRGLDAVLVPLHVGAEALPTFFEGLRGMKNLGGLIVTVPHKGAIPGLCDEVSQQARLIDAANTVRRDPDGRMSCTMFDGVGCVAGMVAEGHDPRGKRVLMAGAGGAANAVAFALADAGAAAVHVTNRTRAKAETLAARVADAYPGVNTAAVEPNPAGYDIVLNATSLGMKPDDPLPLDVTPLIPGQTVVEIIMKPEMTPILIEAQKRGCAVHLGRHMLDHQVRLMADFLRLEDGP